MNAKLAITVLPLNGIFKFLQVKVSVNNGFVRLHHA